MLTPAVEAYGWPFVVLCLVVAALAILTVVIDSVRTVRRWERTERAAAMRRHPVGRHRAPRPGAGLHSPHVGFHGDHRIVP